jgi:Site-specific recombinase XerD
MKKNKKMKLPNGFGSITKLSGNRRNPYIVRVTTGFDKSGNQKMKPLGYYPTYEAALQALALYNHKPYNTELKNITFEKLYNRWIEKKERQVEDKELSEASLKLYKNAFKNHCEKLHKKSFISIKTHHIQQLIDECERDYTIKSYIKSLFSQLYEYAMQLDIPVNKNYAEYVEIKASTMSTLHTDISEQDLNKLWDNLYKVEDVDLALIIAYTGLRASELLNILTENVHIKERYMVGGNKTKAGKDRIIPIHERIVPLIENRLKSAGTFLITSNWGMKLSYNAFRERWDKMMSKLKMKYLPHDGRFTCATRLDNVEANDTCIKIILGHTIKDITKGVYTKKTTEQLIQTINLVA